MKFNYELNAVREAYNGIKKLCYECSDDCDGCKAGLIREQIVELEKYFMYEAAYDND